MPTILTLPKLSPTMEKGTIVKWHKKIGDAIEPGDVLLEIATDKATVEHSALDEGILRQILINEGEEAEVNQPIAVTTETADESMEGFTIPSKKKPEVKAEQPAATEQPQAEKEIAPRQGAGMMQPLFAPEQPLEAYQFEYPTEQLERRTRASPLAKKLAEDRNLDISSVKGTGPGGRVIASDLDKAQPASKMAFGRKAPPTTPPGSYEEVSLTPIRKIIAQRLQEAKTFIPHFYVETVVDAAPLLAAREQLKSQDIKVSVNDFIIRACALALRQHPHINAGFHSGNQTIVQFKTIDIAVAVSLESGLVTPILRHADYKNLGELSTEMKYLARRARDGKLAPEEYKGGSFTISNLGMYGITSFQAIINPPQAAILAVGAAQEIPVIKNGQVVPGYVMTLNLSVDHRVIDGALAAQFLQTLKSYLENPSILLI